MKPERAAGDQSDLGVDLFDAGVRQAVFDRGEDPVALLFDCPRELDERWEPAALGPCQPGVQERLGVLGGDAIDLA